LTALFNDCSVLSQMPEANEMSVLTLEGVVENGQIRLRDRVTLPEGTRVYVVIPDATVAPQASIHSPRLVQREQARDFVKQVIKVSSDAEL